MLSRNRMFFALAAGVVVLAAIAFFVAGGSRAPAPKAQPAAANDLLQHPVYKNYRFGGADPSVIDVGIQPLWVPSSAVTEAMRRDRLFIEALAAAGLTIRFHPFLKGADLNFFLERGDLDLGVAGDMPTLSAAAASDVFIPAIINQGFISILTHKITDFRSLRGKRIGFAFGASAHYCLLNALASEGIGEKDVTLVPLDIFGMPPALARGEIDAFTAWEPNSTIFLNSDKTLTVLRRSRYAGYMYFRADFARSRPEAVRLALAALLRSMRWMGERHVNLAATCRWALDAGKAMGGKDLALSVDQYAELVKSEWLDIVPVPAIPDGDFTPDGRLHEQYVFLQKLGKLPPRATWDKIRASLDKTAITAVLDRAKHYRLTEFAYDAAPR